MPVPTSQILRDYRRFCHEQAHDIVASCNCPSFVFLRRRRRGSTFEHLHKNASPVLERLYSGWQHLQHKSPEKQSAPSFEKKQAL